MFMRNIASFSAIELNTSTSESNVISSADICISSHLLERSSDTSQLVLASQSCSCFKGLASKKRVCQCHERASCDDQHPCDHHQAAPGVRVTEPCLDFRLHRTQPWLTMNRRPGLWLRTPRRSSRQSQVSSAGCLGRFDF